MNPFSNAVDRLRQVLNPREWDVPPTPDRFLTPRPDHGPDATEPLDRLRQRESAASHVVDAMFIAQQQWGARYSPQAWQQAWQRLDTAATAHAEAQRREREATERASHAARERSDSNGTNFEAERAEFPIAWLHTDEQQAEPAQPTADGREHHHRRSTAPNTTPTQKENAPMNPFTKIRDIFRRPEPVHVADPVDPAEAERFARAQQAVDAAEDRRRRLHEQDPFAYGEFGRFPEPDWPGGKPTAEDLEGWAELLNSFADQDEPKVAVKVAIEAEEARKEEELIRRSDEAAESVYNPDTWGSYWDYYKANPYQISREQAEALRAQSNQPAQDAVADSTAHGMTYDEACEVLRHLDAYDRGDSYSLPVSARIEEARRVVKAGPDAAISRTQPLPVVTGQLAAGEIGADENEELAEPAYAEAYRDEYEPQVAAYERQVAAVAAGMSLDEAELLVAEQRERDDHTDFCEVADECGECAAADELAYENDHWLRLDAADRLLRTADEAVARGEVDPAQVAAAEQRLAHLREAEGEAVRAADHVFGPKPEVRPAGDYSPQQLLAFEQEEERARRATAARQAAERALERLSPPPAGHEPVDPARPVTEELATARRQAERLQNAVMHANTLDNTPRGFIYGGDVDRPDEFDGYGEQIRDSEGALRAHLLANPRLENDPEFRDYYEGYREEIDEAYAYNAAVDTEAAGMSVDEATDIAEASASEFHDVEGDELYGDDVRDVAARLVVRSNTPTDASATSSETAALPAPSGNVSRDELTGDQRLNLLWLAERRAEDAMWDMHDAEHRHSHGHTGETFTDNERARILADVAAAEQARTAAFPDAGPPPIHAGWQAQAERVERECQAQAEAIASTQAAATPGETPAEGLAESADQVFAADQVFEEALAEEIEAERQLWDVVDEVTPDPAAEQAEARWQAAVQAREAAWQALDAAEAVATDAPNDAAQVHRMQGRTRAEEDVPVEVEAATDHEREIPDRMYAAREHNRQVTGAPAAVEAHDQASDAPAEPPVVVEQGDPDPEPASMGFGFVAPSPRSGSDVAAAVDAARDAVNNLTAQRARAERDQAEYDRAQQTNSWARSYDAGHDDGPGSADAYGWGL